MVLLKYIHIHIYIYFKLESRKYYIADVFLRKEVSIFLGGLFLELSHISELSLKCTVWITSSLATSLPSSIAHNCAFPEEK